MSTLSSTPEPLHGRLARQPESGVLRPGAVRIFEALSCGRPSGRALRLAASSAAILVAALCNMARANGSPPSDRASSEHERLGLSIQKATLENGLRVVMQPDSSSPTVAIALTYDVGARNEQPGQSGFARLLRHLMFQGSRNVTKGEHASLVRARGGFLDASTTSERSSYYEVLPANELALGVWLEADRLKWLELTRQNFESQRRVVQRERGRRVEHAAPAAAAIKLSELVFDGFFPYAHPASGSDAELGAARFESVVEFHRRYYAPGNAVLSIVGDFDADQAITLIRRYFADAERRAPAPALKLPALREQTAGRRLTLQDPEAVAPALYFGWAVPPARSAEHYALELAAFVLGDGESSRLHQLLVKTHELARSVSVWTEGHRGPDLFAATVELTDRAKLGAVVKLVDAELARLAQNGPSATELERSQRRLRARLGFELESNLARAIRFGEYELYWGDARLLGRDLDGYLGVTSRTVRDAVRKYLVPARRSVVEVTPTRANANRAP